MKNKLVMLLAFFFLSTPFLIAQQTVKEIVYFGPNSFRLTESAKDALNKYIAKVNAHLLTKITIIGHTDADGSIALNNTLSQRRAKEVFNYFVSKGIDKDKFSLEFYGEEKPVADNISAAGKEQNRRVEISIEYKANSFGDIFKELNKETQSFNADASKDIDLVGKELTRIIITKATLVNKNGELVNGQVDISLKEFYTKADIVSANLHTFSGDKILETGGMIYISATSNGEVLKVNKGSNIKIEFAGKSATDGMQTFNGQVNSQSINWVLKERVPVVQDPSPAQMADFRDGDYTYREGRVVDTAFYIAKAKIDKIDNMILESGELGWINCDRFYSVLNKTNLRVEADTSLKPQVRLVFKKINSVMNTYFNLSKGFEFNNIPVGETATLISFSLVNDEPYFASKEIVISKDQNVSLTLTKTTMEALKQEFKKLNN